MSIMRKSQRKAMHEYNKDMLKSERTMAKIKIEASKYEAGRILEIAYPKMKADIEKKLSIELQEDFYKKKYKQMQELVRGEMLVLVTLALRDEFGFGKKRLEQFARRFIDIADTVDDDKYCNDINIHALSEVLKQETSFDMENYVNTKDDEIKSLKALGKYASRPVYESKKAV